MRHACSRHDPRPVHGCGDRPSGGLGKTTTLDKTTTRARGTTGGKATRPDGSTVEFTCTARLDTPIEVEYYRNGGILQTVIRKKLNEAKQPV